MSLSLYDVILKVNLFPHKYIFRTTRGGPGVTLGRFRRITTKLREWDPLSLLRLDLQKGDKVGDTREISVKPRDYLRWTLVHHLS